MVTMPSSEAVATMQSCLLCMCGFASIEVYSHLLKPRRRLQTAFADREQELTPHVAIAHAAHVVLDLTPDRLTQDRAPITCHRVQIRPFRVSVFTCRSNVLLCHQCAEEDRPSARNSAVHSIRTDQLEPQANVPHSFCLGHTLLQQTRNLQRNAVCSTPASACAQRCSIVLEAQCSRTDDSCLDSEEEPDHTCLHVECQRSIVRVKMLSMDIPAPITRYPEQCSVKGEKAGSATASSRTMSHG